MIILSIPQVPLSINQTRTMHWTKLKNIKLLWGDEIWVALWKAGINWNDTPFNKAKISIKIFFRTKRRRDADNYPCKEVIDAIKNNGLIIDDNYDVIGKVDVDITGIDKNNPRTEIEIKEIKCQKQN